MKKPFEMTLSEYARACSSIRVRSFPSRKSAEKYMASNPRTDGREYDLRPLPWEFGKKHQTWRLEAIDQEAARRCNGKWEQEVKARIDLGQTLAEEVMLDYAALQESENERRE